MQIRHVVVKMKPSKIRRLCNCLLLVLLLSGLQLGIGVIMFSLILNHVIQHHYKSSAGIPCLKAEDFDYKAGPEKEFREKVK